MCRDALKQQYGHTTQQVLLAIKTGFLSPYECLHRVNQIRIDIHRMESLFMCLKHLSRNQFSSISLKCPLILLKHFTVRTYFQERSEKKKINQ